MAYVPVLLAPADYAAVRDMLGTDATELPNTTIELLPYLPTAEGVVKARVPTYATVLADDTQDAYYLLKSGTVALVAARLAAFRYAVRQGEEVTREQVLTESWQYRTGPEWQALADRYAAEGLRVLGRIDAGTQYQNAPILLPGVQAGPTQYRRDVAGPRSLEEWVTEVLAPVVDDNSVW
jgi:hypothetical protein